jgi:hypothetical protein
MLFSMRCSNKSLEPEIIYLFFGCMLCIAALFFKKNVCILNIYNFTYLLLQLNGFWKCVGNTFGLALGLRFQKQSTKAKIVKISTVMICTRWQCQNPLLRFSGLWNPKALRIYRYRYIHSNLSLQINTYQIQKRFDVEKNLHLHFSLAGRQSVYFTVPA